jgi:hypothetical protein
VSNFLQEDFEAVMNIVQFKKQKNL